MILYRCYADGDLNHQELYFKEYNVIKCTPCGYWITVFGKRKWTSNCAERRFAYPTKKEAANSFLRKKLIQSRIVRHQKQMTKEALFLVRKFLET